MTYRSDGSLILSLREIENLAVLVERRRCLFHGRDFIEIKQVDGKIRILQPSEHHEAGDYDHTQNAYGNL